MRKLSIILIVFLTSFLITNKANSVIELYSITTPIKSWSFTDYTFLPNSSCIQISQDDSIVCGTFIITPFFNKYKNVNIQDKDKLPTPANPNRVPNQTANNSLETIILEEPQEQNEITEE